MDEQQEVCSQLGARIVGTKPVVMSMILPEHHKH